MDRDNEDKKIEFEFGENFGFGPMGWSALGYVVADVHVTNIPVNRNQLHSSLVSGVDMIAGF